MKGKIAGLPTYVWLGVIAGGLLLGLYLRSRGGGSSNVGANSSYPISLPDNTTGGGDPFGGLSGQSVGGSSSADTSALDADLIASLENGLAVQSEDSQAQTAQLAGLTDALGSLVFTVGSSAGSGSSSKGKHTKTAKKHVTHPAAHKQPKTKRPVPHKVPAHHHPRKKAHR